jgi:hypothetical protein
MKKHWGYNRPKTQRSYRQLIINDLEKNWSTTCSEIDQNKNQITLLNWLSIIALIIGFLFFLWGTLEMVKQPETRSCPVIVSSEIRNITTGIHSVTNELLDKKTCLINLWKPLYLGFIGFLFLSTGVVFLILYKEIKKISIDLLNIEHRISFTNASINLLYSMPSDSYYLNIANSAKKEAINKILEIVNNMDGTRSINL